MLRPCVAIPKSLPHFSRVKWNMYAWSGPCSLGARLSSRSMVVETHLFSSCRNNSDLEDDATITRVREAEELVSRVQAMLGCKTDEVSKEDS